MSLVLDINENRIKIVLIKPKRDKFVIEKFIKIDLPENMVQNGYLVDPSFSIFLKKVLKDNKIKDKKCIVVINSTEIISREITVPVIGKKKLKLLVLNEIENYLGKSIDHIRDFSIIGKTYNNNKDESLKVNKRFKDNTLYNIMVYSTPEKLIHSWYKAIDEVGLKPYKMDIEQNCIAKVYFNSRINNTDIKDQSVISVYLESNRVVLNLILYGKNSFSRVIDFSEGRFNVFESFDMQEENVEQIVDDLPENIDLYNRISSEILKLMQFSLSQKIRKSVSNIYLFGSLTKYKTIVPHLEESLSTKVETIVSLSTIDINANKAQVDTAEVVLSAGSVMGWNL